MYLFKYGRDSTKLLVFMNCLLIVAGVILTAYSMKLNSVLSEYKRILHTTMPYVVIVVTFTGMYSILVVCVGMLGILIQKKMIMYLHLGAFILITLVELSIGSILFCLKQQFLTEILHSLNNSIKQFWRNFYYQLEFNKLQSRFHCCGVNSFEDYLQTKQLIPMSCISGIKPYSIGCIDPLSEFIQYYKTVITYLCFTFGVIHLIYLITSFLLIYESNQGKSVFTKTCCSTMKSKYRSICCKSNI